MSKDHQENILQESLEKLQQQQEEEEEKEEVLEKGEKEEEEGKASRKDVEGEKEEEKGKASRKDVEEEKEEEGCRTPTSSDHQIPTIQSCPPTPKKKVRAINFGKRKLSELETFEATRSEEVESFFRSNSEAFTVESRSIKRRCRSA